MYEGLKDHEPNCEGLASGLSDLELKSNQGVSIGSSREKEELDLVKPLSYFSRVDRQLVVAAFVGI